jgi:hypothetical protein
MTTYPNKEMTAKDLQTGDVIRLHPEPWGTAIVKKKTDTHITFYRPYGTKAEFSYSGGVICYVGIEEFTVPLHYDSFLYHVYQREELK